LTDLDFAIDVNALLTEMLSVLVLALEIMNYEPKSRGLQVNWLKTKIPTTDASFTPGCLVPVVGTVLRSLSLSRILVSTCTTPGPVSMMSGNVLQ